MIFEDISLVLEDVEDARDYTGELQIWQLFKWERIDNLVGIKLGKELIIR